MTASSPSRSRLRLVPSLCIGLAMSVCLSADALGADPVAAQEKQSSPFNNNAPVNYAADRIELQDKAQRVYLSGNVDITQDNLRMRADRTVVAYINDNGVKIQRMDASGNVMVNRGDESATGNLATYDFNRRVITMVGHVVLRRGRDISNAERMVIDLDNHHSSLSSSSTPANGGRVFGQFEVPKKDDKKSTKP